LFKNYKYYETDGIKVYISRGLETINENIYIKLKSFLGLKAFDVSGFRIM
jgi:hypothetical protein